MITKYNQRVAIFNKEASENNAETFAEYQRGELDPAEARRRHIPLKQEAGHCSVSRCRVCLNKLWSGALQAKTPNP